MGAARPVGLRRGAEPPAGGPIPGDTPATRA